MIEQVRAVIRTTDLVKANKIADILCEYCDQSNEERFEWWKKDIVVRDTMITNDSDVHMYYFDYEDMKDSLFENIANRVPDIDFEGSCKYLNDEGEEETFTKEYFEGSLIEVTKNGKRRLVLCKKGYEGDYIMDDSVVEICNGAFSECGDLELVYISENVTKIGKETFNGCKRLRDVYISANVTSIVGKKVFNGCPDVTIHAPEGSFAISYAQKNKLAYSFD